MHQKIKANIPGLGLIGALVAIAFSVNYFQQAVSPLALAVALGFITANFWKWPDWARPGSVFAGKRLLRSGVVLLGAQVSVTALKAIGIKGVLTVVLIVTITIFGIIGLSKLFKMSGELGLLIGVGYGICGATAVAAVRPQTRATEEETSYAIALISLCGTLSIFVLPFLGHLMHLSDKTFGAWAGAAVHDVGQAVATASMWSPSTVSAAIVIKLARVCMLAPIVLILTVRHRKYLSATGQVGEKGAKVPLVPLFIVGFIFVATLQNTVHTTLGFHNFVITLGKVLTAAGLVSLGSSVRWKSIRAIGPRPLAMGLVAWALVAGVALTAVRVTGI